MKTPDVAGDNHPVTQRAPVHRACAAPAKFVGNLNPGSLCVAAVVDNVFVVKTVMHHWEPMP